MTNLTHDEFLAAMKREPSVGATVRPCEPGCHPSLCLAGWAVAHLGLARLRLLLLELYGPAQLRLEAFDPQRRELVETYLLTHVPTLGEPIAAGQLEDVPPVIAAGQVEDVPPVGLGQVDPNLLTLVAGAHELERIDVYSDDLEATMGSVSLVAPGSLEPLSRLSHKSGVPQRVQILTEVVRGLYGPGRYTLFGNYKLLHRRGRPPLAARLAVEPDAPLARLLACLDKLARIDVYRLAGTRRLYACQIYPTGRRELALLPAAPLDRLAHLRALLRNHSAGIHPGLYSLIGVQAHDPPRGTLPVHLESATLTLAPEALRCRVSEPEALR